MELPAGQFFEMMPCYLSVQDRDLRVLKANRRFRDAFGDFNGRYCYQVYKQRSEPCEVCPVMRTFRDGQSHSSEERVRHLDGREVAVIVYTEPIRNAQGEITAVLEMSTDVSDIKLLQGQLKHSQQRYRQLFEDVPCYVSIQDRDLHIVEANRRFCQDFGSYLGCNCYEVYKHRSEPCMPCAVMETFEDGKVHFSEEVVTARNGQRLNMLVYTAPILNPGGQVERVMEMSTDITPIRELQTQLESIGMLISSISHGIKGMLTSLDGGIYLVNSGLEKDNQARVKQGWEMVQRNVERIRGMVLNILYYAKKRDPNWETIAVATLADEVFGALQAKAKELAVKFEQQVAADAGTIEADAKALRALLVNVVENALDACRVDAKKSEHAVVLGVQSYPERICFEIRDNGIGMDRETREKAFSLFFSSKGTEGTGLGLFIANNIARAHGGSIEIESALDQGTRFLVSIPRQRSGGVEGRPQ